MTSCTSIESMICTACSGGTLCTTSYRVPCRGLDSANQFDPNAVRIARKSELVAIFLEGLDLRMRPIRNDFPKRFVHVAYPECEVVQLLPFSIASEELALGGIPIEFEPLRRVRALQFDPYASVVHPSSPRDLHAHHLSVELDRAVEVPDSNAGVVILHDNPMPTRSGAAIKGDACRRRSVREGSMAQCRATMRRSDGAAFVGAQLVE